MAPTDGGPAFPGGLSAEDGRAIHEGMSLRDYFAGQALAGMLANSLYNNQAGAGLGHVATAYKYADAMLKARDAA